MTNTGPSASPRRLDLLRQLGIDPVVDPADVDETLAPGVDVSSAVLGLALLNAEQKSGLFRSLLYGFGSALGFTLVMLIFAGLRERIALVRVPGAFSGAPVAFVTISLLALAFMGFAGFKL